MTSASKEDEDLHKRRGTPANGRRRYAFKDLYFREAKIARTVPTFPPFTVALILQVYIFVHVSCAVLAPQLNNSTPRIAFIDTRGKYWLRLPCLRTASDLGQARPPGQLLPLPP